MAGTVPATQSNATTAAQMSQVTGIIGLASQTIGAYYGAIASKEQYKQAALTYKLKAEMGKINAELAESQAQYIYQAGIYQAMGVGLQAGARRGAIKASLAMRGVQAGVGSAAEIVASNELMKEIDLNTIKSNTVRAAESQKLQAVGIAQSAKFDQLSASNMLSNARQISPGMAAGTTLLQGASNVAQTFMLGS